MCAIGRERSPCGIGRLAGGACCGGLAVRSGGELSGALFVASSVRARLRGLLGRNRFEGVLMLAPCCDVHTVGMRFAVDVAFVGQDGTVLASRRNLAPGRRMAVKGAACVLERQASDGGSWFCPGDRVVLGIGREEEDEGVSCVQG